MRKILPLWFATFYIYFENVHQNARFEASENMIWYNIDVGDLDDLTIKLYNDGYEYEVSATSGENFGEFFELEADTEYNLAVCDEKVLKEISETRTNNASIAIRKHFWKSAEPKIIVKSNILQHVNSLAQSSITMHKGW